MELGDLPAALGERLRVAIICAPEYDPGHQICLDAFRQLPTVMDVELCRRLDEHVVTDSIRSQRGQRGFDAEDARESAELVDDHPDLALQLVTWALRGDLGQFTVHLA